MEKIQAAFDNILAQFIAFIDDLVNKYLKDVKLEINIFE